MEDREINAMKSIAEHFADMDRASCGRVVSWAQARFVDVNPHREVLEAGMVAEQFNKFMAGIKRVAEKHRADPNAIAVVMDAAARVAALDGDAQEAALKAAGQVPKTS